MSYEKLVSEMDRLFPKFVLILWKKIDHFN